MEKMLVKKILLLLVTALFLTPQISRAAEGDGWLTDYWKAVQQAKTQNKKLLMLFTGSDWCPWCKKLDSDVLQTQEFKDYAKEKLVLLYLDFPRSTSQSSTLKVANKKLDDQFKPGGFPAVIVLDAGGNEIFRVAGYLAGGPGVYIKHIEAASWVDDLRQAALPPADYETIKKLMDGGMEKCNGTSSAFHFVYIARNILENIHGTSSVENELRAWKDRLPPLTAEQTAAEAQWAKDTAPVPLPVAVTAVTPAANTPPSPSDIKVFTLKSGKKIIGVVDNSQLMEGVTFVNTSTNGGPPIIKTVSENQIASITTLPTPASEPAPVSTLTTAPAPPAIPHSSPVPEKIDPPTTPAGPEKGATAQAPTPVLNSPAEKEAATLLDDVKSALQPPPDYRLLRNLLNEALEKQSKTQTFPQICSIGRTALENIDEAKVRSSLTDSLKDHQAIFDKTTDAVKKIVNQRLPALSRTPEAHGYSWYHPGAIKPDFNTVDIRKTQEFPFKNDQYITSAANPNEMFRGDDCEFNTMTKYFVTNRDFPQKKLTEAEMLEINRLYRILGGEEGEITDIQNCISGMPGLLNELKALKDRLPAQ